jgi:hypothetical protein
MSKMRFFTSRYETELEILVRLAWKGVPLIPVRLKSIMRRKEKSDPFQKGQRFFQISLLNTPCVLLLFYMDILCFSENGSFFHTYI